MAEEWGELPQVVEDEVNQYWYNRWLARRNTKASARQEEDYLREWLKSRR